MVAIYECILSDSTSVIQPTSVDTSFKWCNTEAQ